MRLLTMEYISKRLKFNNFLYLLFLCIILSESCKTPKKAHINNAKKDTLSDYVLTNFAAHRFICNKLNAKVDVLTNIDGKKQSFSATIRMKKDSIIWISVSPFLGIEIMRIVLTQDSAKVLNRLDNTYFLTDNNYLKTMLKADVDFNMLQAVMLGNDFPHFESGVFDVKRKDNEFCLNTKKRAKLRNVHNNSNLTINQEIHLDADTYKIIKNNFNDVEEKYKFDLVYSNFKTIENQLFPYNIDCKIVTGNKTSDISVEYSKLNLTSDFSYPFAIPDKYTKMTTQQ